MLWAWRSYLLIFHFGIGWRIAYNDNVDPSNTNRSYYTYTNSSEKKLRQLLPQPSTLHINLMECEMGIGASGRFQSFSMHCFQCIFRKGIEVKKYKRTGK